MIELFARSQGMREAVGLAERVSSTDANVLITGESGAGKDLLASFIHSKSKRAAAATSASARKASKGRLRPPLSCSG